MPRLSGILLSRTCFLPTLLHCQSHHHPSLCQTRHHPLTAVFPHKSWYSQMSPATFSSRYFLHSPLPFVCSCQSISAHSGTLPARYCNVPFPNKLPSSTYVLFPGSTTPAKTPYLLFSFPKRLRAGSRSGVFIYSWFLVRL